MVFGIVFGSTLECANLNHLVFNAKLSHYVLIVHGLCSQAVPVEHTLRVDVYLVCNRCKIVGTLRVSIAISYNPLATLAEVFKRISYLLQCSHASAQGTSLHVYTLYTLVGLSLLDRGNDVVHANSRGVVACKLAKDIVLSLLAYRARKIEHKHRPIFNGLCSLSRSYHANNTHHTEYAGNNQKNNDADNGSGNVLEEFFHTKCVLVVCKDTINY